MHGTILKAVRRAVEEAASQLHTHRQRVLTVLTQILNADCHTLRGGGAGSMLRVTLNDDDGVIGVDDDRVMRTAPLGVANGAVVGVVPGCPSG